MKRIALLLAVVTVAAACAGAEVDSATTDVPQASPSPTVLEQDAKASSDANSTVTSPSTDDESVASEVPVPKPDGPTAPNFTLALGDGGTFTLYDEQKPTYMIFWAEW